MFESLGRRHGITVGVRQADASSDLPMLDELVNVLEPTAHLPPHAIAHAQTTRRHRLSCNRVSHDSVEAS